MRNLSIAFVLLFSILFFACRPTPIQEIQDARSFCEQNITEGNRIERVEIFENGLDKRNIYKHNYNTQGLLKSIKSINNDRTEDTFIYDTKNRLVAKIKYTYFTGEYSDMDSLIYNNEGKVSKIATYVLYNFGAKRIEFGFIDYFYNFEGQLVKDTNNRQGLNTYEWENGNLIKIKTFNTLGSDVLWEKIFTYDNKVNPYPSFINKGRPYRYNYFEKHGINTKNNVTKVEWKTYINSQNPDSLSFEYCYNAQGFPIFIKNSSGDSTLIFYEK
jgi:hypothetical protein